MQLQSFVTQDLKLLTECVLFLEEKILHLRPDQERDQTNFVDQSVRAFTVVDCINFLLIS